MPPAPAASASRTGSSLFVQTRKTRLFYDLKADPLIVLRLFKIRHNFHLLRYLWICQGNVLSLSCHRDGAAPDCQVFAMLVSEWWRCGHYVKPRQDPQVL